MKASLITYYSQNAHLAFCIANCSTRAHLQNTGISIVFKRMGKLSFRIVACYVVLFLSMAMAQQVGAINLPGHLKGPSEALKQGVSVAVATLKSIGRRDLGSAGVDIYSYVDLKIDERLNGDFPGEIVGTFSRLSGPATLAEAVPAVGEKYIIIFRREHHDYPGQAYTIIKFTAFSIEEREKVKKLIDQSK
jgi:hypothetical protein